MNIQELVGKRALLKTRRSYHEQVEVLKEIKPHPAKDKAAE